MRLEHQIIAAVALDLLLGDPRWLPHPVKLMGRLALKLEAPFRRLISQPRAAGVATALAVLLVTAPTVFLALKGARRLHPVLGDLVSILFLYSSLAVRDLATHSRNVYRALRNEDLARARKQVALIVGRDTAHLDEPGVVRAAVESVAENLVDGVTAPLFFALLGGAVGAICYKAVNTLDSTFGYRNARYLEFGWASARMDDLATYLPARVTAPLVPVAAMILRLTLLHPGLMPLHSLQILLRDGGHHSSPNAGLSEAAFAGALGVQLGGPSSYDGKVVEKPTLGDPLLPLQRSHIPGANSLMLLTSALAMTLLVAVRIFALSLWQQWRGGA